MYMYMYPTATVTRDTSSDPPRKGGGCASGVVGQTCVEGGGHASGVDW